MNKESDDDVGCIVGAVVQLQPTVDACAIKKQLLSHQGVEIHAEDAQARLVITMEQATSKQVLLVSEAIQKTQGVLSITPVYQHCEEITQNDEQGGWKWR